VGSNDVKALYPSCKTELSAAVCRRAVGQSSMDIETDNTSLALFVALNLTQDQINAEGIRHCIHTWKIKKEEDQESLLNVSLVAKKEGRRQ
jgi:hypothetical protein